jgi:hypothetical protein
LPSLQTSLLIFLLWDVTRKTMFQSAWRNSAFPPSHPLHLLAPVMEIITKNAALIFCLVNRFNMQLPHALTLAPLTFALFPGKLVFRRSLLLPFPQLLYHSLPQARMLLNLSNQQQKHRPHSFLFTSQLPSRLFHSPLLHLSMVDLPLFLATKAVILK